MSIGIFPIGDQVLVKRSEKEETTVSGIIFFGEIQMQGEVIATGRGKQTPEGKIIPMDVVVGDIVLLPKFSGTDIKFGNDKYIMIKEEDILGILICERTVKTHSARLMFIKEIVKENCAHEPKHVPGTIKEMSHNFCKHCGVELKATWSQIK